MTNNIICLKSVRLLMKRPLQWTLGTQAPRKSEENNHKLDCFFKSRLMPCMSADSAASEVFYVSESQKSSQKRWRVKRNETVLLRRFAPHSGSSSELRLFHFFSALLLYFLINFTSFSVLIRWSRFVILNSYGCAIYPWCDTITSVIRILIIFWSAWKSFRQNC